MPLDALLPHVPAAIHGELKRSRYLAAKSACLVVHADDSRRQSDNARSCYRRLLAAIVDAGRRAVPAETSPEQAQRVKLLYVVLPSDGPGDGPKADKPTARNPITSAASRPKSTTAPRSRPGEAPATTEARLRLRGST